MAGLCGGKDMIQHLLAKPFAAMRGVDQQEADIGIIGVGKAKQDLGHGDQLTICEPAKVQFRGRVNARWGAGEEIIASGRLSGGWPDSSNT